MRSPQVFISYDHRDEHWVSNKLVPKLRDAGLTERHDSQIHLGTSIYEWIDSSRSECKAFVLVISRNYLQNRSFARAEMVDLLIRALKGRLRVVPIYKEAVDDDELPFGLLSINSIRCLDSIDLQIKELAAQLRGENIPAAQNYEMIANHYIPSERRIRIQSSTVCTQTCPWCHWDDFPKDVKAIDYHKVLELMSRLKEARDLDHVTYPRPNICFTLTGGEPLANRSDNESDVTWKTLASVDPQNTYLLTNGRLLDDEAIDFINTAELRRIRIDLPVIPNSDYRGVEVSQLAESIQAYYENVLIGIHKLLESSNVEIRFNYVITDNKKDEVESYLNFIRNNYREYIGNKINGVAFIEKYPNTQPALDVFKVAEEWSEREGGSLHKDPLAARKRQSITSDGMKVEFVKLNCAAIGDLIFRCFACVQEQDIAISADGRIRICTGWDTGNQSCRYVYAHIYAKQPLVGISGVIRRRYGNAGFYNHFGIISNIIAGKSVPNFVNIHVQEFDTDAFREFMQKFGVPLSDARLRDYSFVSRIAELVLSEEPRFRRLYEEGTYSEDILNDSTRLSCFLLRAAYSLASQISRSKEDYSLRFWLNGILLLLEYLCVDESLFSTGRTLMVQGMSTDLLKDLAKNAIAGSFLSDSSYCLSAVAFENCDAKLVLQFLESQVPSSDIQKVAWVQYLIGCLNRQCEEEKKAISAFELSYRLADDQIIAHSNRRFNWLLREVRVEAKRSLGAIRKGKGFGRAQEDFTLANFLSSVDNTKLRYAALYSDGYASMRHFFQCEIGNNSFPKQGYKAHRDFCESIALNPTFYASLIRMGLLELALGQASIAEKRLSLAKRSFSKRGLLTDQEYLNSLLCDLIYLVCLDDLSLNSRQQTFCYIGIADCKNVGKKDVSCVKEDAEFLKKYIDVCCDEQRRIILVESVVINNIMTFIDKCNNLLCAQSNP